MFHGRSTKGGLLVCLRILTNLSKVSEILSIIDLREISLASLSTWGTAIIALLRSGRSMAADIIEE